MPDAAARGSAVRRGARRLPLVFIAFWALPAVVAVAGFQVVPSARNPGISLGALAASQALVWSAWALWSLVIVLVSERVPFERGRVARAIATHLPLSLLVIALQILVTANVSAAFDLSARRGLESMLAIGFRSYGDLYTVIYWAIVGAHAAFRWHAAWQEEGVRAAQLERDLSAAQLTTLRSQLNPHFLFNALNSVVTLIPRDQDGASRMVIRLASLLRATLGMADAQEIALERELEMVRNYLDIETVRFADRLRVRWAIAPDTRAARVPSFALQPLVENAIVHGIARRAAGGTIVVAAERRDDRLVLTVRDDGAGPAPNARGAGIGLANLRARVQRLYGSEAAEVRVEREGGETIATLSLPFIAAAPAATVAPDFSPAPSSPPDAVASAAPRPVARPGR